ncbi:MAG TPA: hypothetical protein DEP67_08550 [Lachnospiraceae bacterium]|nr:hypothetical protein [Lachnospiraceae bacterium]
MSAYLGPVHYWLYNKIGKQEELTGKLASYSAEKGWIGEPENFTARLPELESVIDVSNIHGWLQSRIADSETRLASLVKGVLSGHPERMEALLGVAYAFGQDNRPDAASASDIYRAFEDFFVNGMPCDRVNVVDESSDDQVSWHMAEDIHAAGWNGDAADYYRLRSSVMAGMLDRTPFVLDENDGMQYTIRKRS